MLGGQQRACAKETIWIIGRDVPTGTREAIGKSLAKTNFALATACSNAMVKPHVMKVRSILLSKTYPSSENIIQSNDLQAKSANLGNCAEKYEQFSLFKVLRA